MIRVSLRLGAMVAGADAEQLAALDAYGRRLGLAFQITDDLLDVQSSEAATGKRVGKDAQRGKLTFPGLLGLDQSTQHAEQLIAEACEALAPFGARGRRAAGAGPVCPGKESLMDKLLSTINSPEDLKKLSHKQLEQLAAEMREALCRLAATRTAHFASNLGVVELTLALHTTFDFSRDRLIWDTGHQVYAHKMVTGRYDEFHTMRAKGGLMGYPNPAESDYDLFMTGHAGCSVGTALGLKCGDDLLRPDENRHVVAVVGDGAFPCGMVFEAMNNAGGLKKNLIVILNDNKMSICPRVGGLAESLDRLRMAHFYTGLKAEVQKMLNRVPVIGDPVERFLSQMKDAVKAGLLGGMIFEDLGFRYIGPVDGHNIRQLQKYLSMVRQFQGPVLLHVVTEKGHGFQPAAEDPTTFHAPAPFQRENGSVVPVKKASGRPPYTAVGPRRRARRRCGPTRRSWRSPPPCARATCSNRSATSFPTASSTWASANRTPWPSPPGWPRPACGRSSTSTAPSCSGATTRSSRKWPCRTCRSRCCWTAPGWSAPTGRRTTACSTWPTCGRCRTWW